MSFINIDTLLLIAGHVDDHRDYFRMLRVCRGWHAVLYPGAYSRISVQNDEVYDFVRHIYKNPSLGAQIRDLSISWHCEGPEIESDVTLIQDELRRQCDSHFAIERWSSDLRKRLPDSWLAVLVPSLVGVTNLSLSYYKTSWFLYTIQAAVLGKMPFDTASVLQNLKSVTVLEDEMYTGLTTGELISLFRLPAMRVFKGHNISEVFEDNDEAIAAGSLWKAPEPGTSGIREIRLGGPHTRCNGHKGMAEYITSCANLEIFEYQHGRVEDPSPGRIIFLGFRPHGFYKALVTQKHSLRELRLSDRGENFTKDCFEDEEGELYENEEWHNMHPNKFGSLVEFCKLRELRIPVETILQIDLDGDPTVSLVDILPPSLEYLHLSHCELERFPMMMDHLHRMVEHKTDKFPNLRRLCVRPLERSSSQVSFMLAPYDLKLETFREAQLFFELEEACNNAGIRFWISKGESLAGDEPSN